VLKLPTHVFFINDYCSSSRIIFFAIFGGNALVWLVCWLVGIFLYEDVCYYIISYMKTNYHIIMAEILNTIMKLVINYEEDGEEIIL
jgi:hypothetical protein